MHPSNSAKVISTKSVFKPAMIRDLKYSNYNYTPHNETVQALQGNTVQRNYKQSFSGFRSSSRSIDLLNNISKRSLLSIMTPPQGNYKASTNVNGKNDSTCCLSTNKKINFPSRSTFDVSPKYIEDYQVHQASVQTETRKIDNQISQCLQYCNLSQLDSINEQRKEIITQNLQKQVYSINSTITLKNLIKMPNNSQKKEKDKDNNKNQSNFIHFNYKLPTKNFTLQHINQFSQPQSPKDAEIINNKLLVQKRLKTRIQRTNISRRELKTQNETPQFDEDGLTEKQPNFTRYIISQPMKKYDMIFNVKQMVRLQKQRENELNKQKEVQIEIIRRKNQIQVLIGNSQKTKQMQTISAEVYQQTQNQSVKAESMIDQLTNLLKL